MNLIWTFIAFLMLLKSASGFVLAESNDFSNSDLSPSLISLNLELGTNHISGNLYNGDNFDIFSIQNTNNLKIENIEIEIFHIRGVILPPPSGDVYEVIRVREVKLLEPHSGNIALFGLGSSSFLDSSTYIEPETQQRDLLTFSINPDFAPSAIIPDEDQGQLEYTLSITATSVPEPSTSIFMMCSSIALCITRRRSDQFS